MTVSSAEFAISPHSSMRSFATYQERIGGCGSRGGSGGSHGPQVSSSDGASSVVGDVGMFSALAVGLMDWHIRRKEVPTEAATRR